MLIAERQTRLKDLLSKRGMCDLETLAAELGVSLSTVRRDVESLEQSGVVHSTRGGVIWAGDSQGNSPAFSGLPYAFDQRVSHAEQAKKLIAKAARSLVQPGDTVFIDGGTTTFHLAQELLGLPIQLVTNSLPIANLFLNDEHVELILAGGLVYPRYGVLLGPLAESALSTIHTRAMFLSVAGVSQGRLYNQNQLLVQAERRMMEQSQQVILLVDAAKFGQQALVQLGTLDEVNVVVTNAEPSAEDQKFLSDAGCRVIVAE
jgi:DeoR/GlpR family transcriptional regulator of sugar metabolism